MYAIPPKRVSSRSLAFFEREKAERSAAAFMNVLPEAKRECIYGTLRGFGVTDASMHWYIAGLLEAINLCFDSLFADLREDIGLSSNTVLEAASVR